MFSFLLAVNTTKPSIELYTWLLAYQPQDTLLASLTDSVLPEVFLTATQNLTISTQKSQLNNSDSLASLKTTTSLVSQSQSSSGLAFEDNFCPPPPVQSLQKSNSDSKVIQQRTSKFIVLYKTNFFLVF